MDKAKAQVFMGRVIADLGAAMTVALVHVGDRVGLFKAMAGAGELRREQLEQRTGIHPRYLEEWLAAMLCAGYIEHQAETDTWRLPDEHALFFADASSEQYMGGLFYGAPGLAAMAPQLADAFQAGSGISFQDYGEAAPMAVELMNRSLYQARFIQRWMPNLPQVVARLQQGGRALDVGCGTGTIAILLAQAFPQARITALDFDARSIVMARENAARAGVAERIRFIQQSATELDGQGEGWDFISSFDCIHDMPDPQGVLRRIHNALAPEGSYLMVEPKVADSVDENAANPFARYMYGISCLHCVPQSLAQGGPGLGACWGEARARRMAREAGFSHFAALPIPSLSQSFYELRA